MKRYLFLALAVMLLLVASCDRFDNSLTKPVEDEGSLSYQIKDAFRRLSSEDHSSLDELYDDDYAHFGITKAQRIAGIVEYFAQGEIGFSVNVLNIGWLDSGSNFVDWRLKILKDGQVLADSLFLHEEAKKVDGRWHLGGNKVVAGDDEQQLVIAEYFTFRTCPNCPPAEAKLAELASLHPNFIYLEHHTMMELAVPGNDTGSYYGNPLAPSVVFQGEEKLSGSAAATLESYDTLYEYYSNQPQSFGYTVLSGSFDGENIAAEVKLSSSLEDLSEVYLNYVFITDDVNFTNIQGGALHNVVRAVGRKALAGVNLNENIELSLSIGGTQPAPSAGKLVIFAQKRPQPFEGNATIYGGKVIPLSIR